MGKPKSKADRQKARKAKQRWHKRGLASTKAFDILLKLSDEDPQRDADPGPSATDHAKSLVCNLLGRKTPENQLTWCHDDEANLLQDVDLVVLAASPEEYKHYTTLLRSEYANLDDATYKAMRIKVLETLLMIPSIYATGDYHDKYEELARANIRSEIGELKKQ